ncbi:hypothetical protein [Priestia sp. D3YE.R1]|uniref:restriction endonuclease subunit S n=1 Tax=Priestia sp. D3YE.R1 TaxID=3400416 RepID=UPI003BA03EED
MLEPLLPYLEYKDSEQPCFGQIPKHWKVLRNGQIFSQRNQTGFPDLPILEVSLKTGVRVRDFENSKRKQVLNDREKYKRVVKGDIAYNMMRMWQGAVGVAPVGGLVSPAYVVARPLSEVNSQYYSYLFRTHTYMNEVNKYSHGIVTDRNRLYWDEFKQIPSLFPPYEEQNQIVKYLDFQLMKINRFIKVKQKLILTLKEEIECYLYGNHEKLDTIIVKSWDTAFPTNWPFVKSKRIFKERNIKNCIDSELLAVTQDRGVVYKKDCEHNYVSPSGELSGLKLVRNGDFVISLRSFQGGIEFSKIEGIVSPAYTIFCLRNEFSSEEYKLYYKYLFKTKVFISMLNTLVSGIRDGKNINYSDFSNKFIPVPPLKTVEQVAKLVRRYEIIKKQFESELVLLNEYRTRLISDVVTGKVDVSGVIVEEVAAEDIVMDIVDGETENHQEVLDREECEV